MRLFHFRNTLFAIRLSYIKKMLSLTSFNVLHQVSITYRLKERKKERNCNDKTKKARL